jgi:hypothetical protein
VDGGACEQHVEVLLKCATHIGGAGSGAAGSNVMKVAFVSQDFRPHFKTRYTAGRDQQPP